MTSCQAALLDEMDEVFGVGALVADDQHRDRQEAYHQEHLKGLRVAHTLDAVRYTHRHTHKLTK